MKTAALAVLTALTLAMAAIPAAAQTQTRLTGTVYDDTGSVIPGARITILNINTGVSQEAETNASGSYNFPFVSAGHVSVVRGS